MDNLRIVLPKGHLQERIVKLLERLGMSFYFANGSYRPRCNVNGIAAKLLKPQNIPGLVSLGRHDCGFTGYDWIEEEGADVVQLLDLRFDPVRIVVAGPEGIDLAAIARTRPLIVASEYERLTRRYIASRGLNAVFVRSFGATEVLPPEDADLIVDNTASGETLTSHRLAVIDVLLTSSTRFIANRRALEDSEKGRRIRELQMLIESALRARERVLLEMNVPGDRFEDLVRWLPAMQAPTVSALHGGQGYAIKIAVPTNDVPTLIPRLVAAGARDILEYQLEKIVLSPEPVAEEVL